MRTGLPGTLIILIVTLTFAACSSGRYEPFVSEPGVIGPVADDTGRTMFYDDLAPHGEWTWIAGPGWVWSPHAMPVGWRPYTLGHWVYTDYGWTWNSNEEFGWAVYHYGRWHQDAARGWVWAPGLEWGPAWVAWHSGSGWVGWAPLPWQVSWRADVGLDWGGVSVSLEPSVWCFAQTRHLTNPGLSRYLAPASRNVTLVRTTTNITNYTFVENHIVNSSVSIERVGRAVGHSIPHYRVRHADSPEDKRGGIHERDLVVFRPGSARSYEVRQNRAAKAVRQGTAATTAVRQGTAAASAIRKSVDPHRQGTTARPHDDRGNHQHGTGAQPGGAADSQPDRGEKSHANHPKNDSAPPSKGPDRAAPQASPGNPTPGHQPQVTQEGRKDPKPAVAPGKRGGEKANSSKSKAEQTKADMTKDEDPKPGKSKDDKPETDGS